MKFNIELNLDDYANGEGWFSESDFIEDLKNSVSEKIGNNIISQYVTGYYAKDNIEKIIKDTINQHIDEIIKTIVEKVSKSIEKKKRIAEITPRASVIASIDKENEAYFNTLIEKCIARKFK